MKRDGRKLHAAVTALLVSVVATSWCWWTAGPGLALFFGGILLAALYVPPLTLAEKPEARWIANFAFATGIAACWLASLARVDVSLFEWLRCSLVCAAFVFALSGIASALASLRLAPPVAATLTVILALAWLSWPVWLSPWLTQRMVDWLVPAHPLLAINGVLQHLGSWDRAPIAYRQLTNLNQDIAYHLPRSIIPAVAVHGAIGLLALLPIHSHGRPANVSTAAVSPSPPGRGLG